MAYLGTPPQSGFITTAKQRVTSSTNAYVDLDHAISSIADVIVFVNFVKQDTTNLTLTTSTRITLGATLVSSDIVEIHYLGKAVNTQTPGTATVTNDMLAGSIANDKLAGSIANSKLANSSVSINGSTLALGGSLTGIGENNLPAFKAVMSSSQSISNSSGTKINFDTEELDNNGSGGGAYDTSNKRWTPNVGGYYYILASALIEHGDAAGEYGSLYIEKGGNQVIANRLPGLYYNISTSLMVAGIVHMNGSSDWLECHIWQNHGSARTLDPNIDYTTFMGFKIFGT